MNNSSCGGRGCSTDSEPEKIALKRFKSKEESEKEPEKLALERFKEKQKEE